MTEMKRCSGATMPGDRREVLVEPHSAPLTDFAKDRTRASGVRPNCKSCYKLTQRMTPVLRTKDCLGVEKFGITISEPHVETLSEFNFDSDSRTYRDRCRDCEKKAKSNKPPAGFRICGLRSENGCQKLFPADEPGKYLCRDCKAAYDQKRAESIKRIGFEQIESKTCSSCGDTKSSDEFGVNQRSKDGLHSYCRTCASKKSRQWATENPLQASIHYRAYHDRKKAQPNEKVSKEVLLEIHGPNCYLCGKPVPENISDWDMEHVIPISRGKVGTTYANCRVAHASCNRSKGSKTYFEHEIQRSTHYVTIDNLYLFNENAEWHYRQILKEALERGKQ